MSTPASSLLPPPRDASPVRERIHLPLAIPVEPYLKDHRFFGKIILPAVEILQQLAASLRSFNPAAPVLTMRSATFDRFLQIHEDAAVVDACHELEIHENGRLSSRLTTKGVIAGTRMKRTKVHAAVDFTASESVSAPFPMDLAAALEGICLELPARTLYGELVPFGPAYQNVREGLFLSEDGAIGQVDSADIPAASTLLGSPFPFDGALHAACAWGQRFRGIVAFPVGFEKRLIARPTIRGERYHFRILPLAAAGETLRFDIRIHDQGGELCEEIRGVMMKDVSGGRVRPPAWLVSDGSDPLAALREQCAALSVIELGTVADFAVISLSPGERERFEKMGKRRQKSFLAGRLALKTLSRKIAGGEPVTPASAIHTIMPDGVRPCCPSAGQKAARLCSLSHDARFALAVAADEPIGVDVERVSDRVLRARRLYMGKDELALTGASPLGSLEASLRVWSIKEGASKALNRPLAQSWRTVQIEEVGRNRSTLTVDGVPYAAFHAAVDDHVFTLVKREGPRS